jgi:hypothetical protein
VARGQPQSLGAPVANEEVGMKRSSQIIAAVLTISMPAISHAEVVQTAERTFRVRYRDGAVELYKVRWVATRDMASREHGGPAKPFEGKFVDDRRCEWNINGGITRTVSLITRNGKEVINEDKTRVFNSDFRNEGTSFDLATLRPGNCNDTAARRDSDYNDVRRQLTEAIGPTVSNDFETLKREYLTDGANVEQR